MVKLTRDVGYDISDDIPCIPQFSKYSGFNTNVSNEHDADICRWTSSVPKNAQFFYSLSQQTVRFSKQGMSD